MITYVLYGIRNDATQPADFIVAVRCQNVPDLGRKLGCSLSVGKDLTIELVEPTRATATVILRALGESVEEPEGRKVDTKLAALRRYMKLTFKLAPCVE